MSSESSKAIHSPEALLIPAFLAADGPPLARLMTLTPIAAASAALSSVDPSSTTMISSGFNVCAKTDSRHRGRNAAEL